MADTSPIHINSQTLTGLLFRSPAIQRYAVSILARGRGRHS